MSAKLEKKREKKKKKCTARLVCNNGDQFWVTQATFWQWVRDKVVVKIQDHPLTGQFRYADEERMIMLCKTILNLSAPNHLNEALYARRKFRCK